MPAVHGECQSQKIGLLCVGAGTLVGKVPEFVRLQIQDCQRLFLARGVGPIPAVQQYCEFPVWRNRGNCRKIIRRPRIAGHIPEQFSIGQLSECRVRWFGLGVEFFSPNGQQQYFQKPTADSRSCHGRIIFDFALQNLKCVAGRRADGGSLRSLTGRSDSLPTPSFPARFLCGLNCDLNYRVTEFPRSRCNEIWPLRPLPPPVLLMKRSATFRKVRAVLSAEVPPARCCRYSSLAAAFPSHCWKCTRTLTVNSAAIPFILQHSRCSTRLGWPTRCTKSPTRRFPGRPLNLQTAISSPSTWAALKRDSRTFCLYRRRGFWNSSRVRPPNIRRSSW